MAVSIVLIAFMLIIPTPIIVPVAAIAVLPVILMAIISVAVIAVVILAFAIPPVPVKWFLQFRQINTIQ